MNKLPETWEEGSTGFYMWTWHHGNSERFWVFHVGFGICAWRDLANEKLKIALFNPLGSSLELVEFGYHDPAKRVIPLEMAHCLVEAFATPSDRQFYGNPHILLTQGEIIELPSGVQLYKRPSDILNCFIVSQQNSREDIMGMFDGKKT